MIRSSFIVAATTLAATVCTAQTLYKWQDEAGQIHYTDAPPPPKGKLIDEKRGAQGNVIENNQESYATLEAQKRNPVTLYANDCGELCDKARAMLNKRGVPHKAIDPTPKDEFDKFKALTGNTVVPVVKIGETLLSGFDEAQWQAALDKAGYSKTPPARSQQSLRTQRANAQAAVAKDAAKEAAKDITSPSPDRKP